MRVQNDPLLALSLLTRLPIRLNDEDFARSAQAAWAYPLVGAVTGALSVTIGLAALALGLPVPIAALLCLATSMSITGAMHEDGLADCADGFWGGWDPAMRLKIMKDSQIGTYGVLALLVTVGLRWSALTVLLTSAHPVWIICAIHVASRAVMPGIMAALPHARETGLSAQVGRVSWKSAAIAAFIGSAGCAFCFGAMTGAGIIMILLAVMFGASQIARKKIGGQTGDVIGAHQQIAEVTLLLCALGLM